MWGGVTGGPRPTAGRSHAETRPLSVVREDAEAGLVSRRRVGRESRFAYRPEPVDEAKSYLDHVSNRWDEALARLRALVED